VLAQILCKQKILSLAPLQLNLNIQTYHSCNQNRTRKVSSKSISIDGIIIELLPAKFSWLHIEDADMVSPRRFLCQKSQFPSRGLFWYECYIYNKNQAKRNAPFVIVWHSSKEVLNNSFVSGPFFVLFPLLRPSFCRCNKVIGSVYFPLSRLQTVLTELLRSFLIRHSLTHCKTQILTQWPHR